MNQPLSQTAKKILQCCRQGALDQLQQLLDQGIDLDQVNHPDFMPLNVALKNGRWQVAKHLLQNRSVPLKTTCPPLIAATQFKKDQTTGMELVFAHTGDLGVIDQNGRTALMTACLLGHDKKVQYLLNGLVDIHAVDDSGMTAFLDAVISQSIGIIELLLPFEVDVHKCNASGDNALSLACQGANPNTRLIKHLLEQGIDSEIKNKQGRSALSMAEKKHPAVHKLFVTRIEAEKQMELPLFADPTSPKPLDTTSSQVDNEPKAQQAQAPRSQSKPSGRQSDWFEAVAIGNLGKLNQLKIQGLDIDTLDPKGCTALIHAAGKGHRAVASYLIQNGASLTHQAPNGATPLSSAIISNSRSLVGLLLKHGASPNGLGPGQYPYVSLAATQWNEDCLSQLLDAGADVNTLDPNGWSLYHHVAVAAEYYTQTEKAKGTLRLLQQHGLDINTTDQHGNTALHLVCGAIKKKAYQADDSVTATLAHELMKLGINHKTINHHGFTAIQYAKQHGLLNTKGVMLSFMSAW